MMINIFSIVGNCLPILPIIPFDGGVRTVRRIGPAGVLGVYRREIGTLVTGPTDRSLFLEYWLQVLVSWNIGYRS